jgi:hypothetical protein
MTRGDLLFAGMIVLLGVTGRLASGRHPDGKRRSDCTFFSAGTHAEPHWWGRGGDPKWALLPGWKRAACWWLVLGVSLGLRFWRTGTVVLLVATVGPALGLLAVRAVRAWYGWQHYRDRVQPLHYALAGELDMPLSVKPSSWLTVPPDYASNKDAQVIVYPPAEFTGSDQARQAIVRTVTTKLGGIEAPEVTWRLQGKNPRIIFAHSEPPPSPPLGWSDVAELAERAGPDEIVFGLGKKRVAVAASLATDSPHVAFNMGTGGGKTNLGSVSALQFLHRGDVAAVIDAKLISYPCLRGLPNVAYAGMVGEIHDLLVAFGEELERRNSKALAGLQPSGAIRADVGPRLVLFAEELNFVVPQLKAYWAALRELDKSLPKRSPALAALGNVSFAGRQVRMHIFFIGQMITAAATGANDSSVRGNIGISCMARYTPSSWSKMTAVPMPPVPTVPGRIQVVTAAGVRETQVPYLHLDDKDEAVADAAARWAREYAVNGKFTRCPDWMPGAVAVPGVPGLPQIEQGGSDLGFVPGTCPVVPALPPTAVTLTKARELGILQLSKAAANKASQRPGFPDSIGWDGPARIWDALDLKAWQDGKVRVLR